MFVNTILLTIGFAVAATAVVWALRPMSQTDPFHI